MKPVIIIIGAATLGLLLLPAFIFAGDGWAAINLFQRYPFLVLPLLFWAVVAWVNYSTWKTNDAASKLALAKTEQINDHGVIGRVKVHSVRSAGTWINKNPQLVLDVTVRISGKLDERLACKRIVNFLVAPRILPGAVYPARVDPDDQTNFFVAAWQ